MSNVDEMISLLKKEPKQDGADFSGFDLKGVSLKIMHLKITTQMITSKASHSITDV